MTAHNPDELSGVVNVRPFLGELARLTAVILAAHPEQPDNLPIGDLVVSISEADVSIGRKQAGRILPIALVGIDRHQPEMHATAPVRLILRSEVERTA